MATTAERIEQRVYFVEKADKRALLRAAAAATRRSTARWSSPAPSTAPTGSPSSSTQAGIGAEAIHGNKSQSARERALDELQDRRRSACWSRPTSPRAASTSTASRTSSTSTCPNVPESYVHRIGRTGARRRQRHRHLVLRQRGAGVPARHREADQGPHPGRRGSPLAFPRRRGFGPRSVRPSAASAPPAAAPAPVPAGAGTPAAGSSSAAGPPATERQRSRQQRPGAPPRRALTLV